LTDIISDIAGAIGGSAGVINSLIQSQGYLALVLLMTLEGIGLPVASEIVIPAAGFLAAKGLLNIWIAFIAILVGNTIGMAIDYTIGYYLEKGVVYKHLELFHVKRESIDAFDNWFSRNGPFAVFISRMIPEIRAIMSFPAGFAKMDLKKFFFWSILGSAIWDGALLLFGYFGYTLAVTNNLTVLFAAIGIFVIVLYAVYRIAIARIKKDTEATRPKKHN
jgi:membrane protein DedA with SNARE-associated domain